MKSRNRASRCNAASRVSASLRTGFFGLGAAGFGSAGVEAGSAGAGPSSAGVRRFGALRQCLGLDVQLTEGRRHCATVRQHDQSFAVILALFSRHITVTPLWYDLTNGDTLAGWRDRLGSS